MTQPDRVFVIAEVGVNHNGSLAAAVELVRAAASAGADAVKFQTFRAEAIASRFAPKADYQVANTGSAESQLEMLRRLELGRDDLQVLRRECDALGVEFMSSPFDVESLRLLQDLPVKRIKLGSGEITNAPLLLETARTGLPLILSTGMSSLEDVREALGVLAFGYSGSTLPPSRVQFRESWQRDGGRSLRGKVTLLHCTTEYPAPFSDVNLNAMESMRQEFGLPVGFSDHTPGIAAPLAAVAKGAVAIEKHISLDRNMEGPDHKASLEPNEFAAMVSGIRQVEQSLGSATKGVAPSESKNREIARKSIVATRAIGRGEPFSTENIGIKRPGWGISPMDFWEVLGKTADRDYEADEVVTMGLSAGAKEGSW